MRRERVGPALPTLQDDPGNSAACRKGLARGIPWGMAAPKIANARSFWLRVEEAEREVQGWPAWKRSAAERVYVAQPREDRASQEESARSERVPE